MIVTLNAYTEELDDAEAAVSQVLSQLEPEFHLKSNAIGIVQCYPEFLDNGIVEAIADALPFDIVGTTTMFNGTQRDHGGLGLSIQVLTSEDVFFSSYYSAPLAENPERNVKQSYKAVAARRDEPPVLMFTFAPFLKTIGGDELVAWLDEASGGVPNFGSLAIDHTPDFSKARSFFNGDYSWDRVGFVLVYGNASPRFLMASVAEENILPQAVTITKSKGNVLMEVNDIPFGQYLEQLGLADGESITAKETLPLVIDILDGAQAVARSMIALTPEGHVILGGTAPVGAQLRIGTMTYLDVAETAEMMFDAAMATERQQCLIVFSCLSRFFALESRINDEIETGKTLIQDHAPFLFGYTGGEICPVPGGRRNREGTINKFHNFTIIACVF
ncbi:MAG: FIST C-terminal domain-containing protein [Clostridiales Family XIII bacterium]|jgi:hypothetical protein|nr:FIST C-terminal domain-containing protein [Clostridiales Family XIII bacterium]